MSLLMLQYVYQVWPEAVPRWYWHQVQSYTQLVQGATGRCMAGAKNDPVAGAKKGAWQVQIMVHGRCKEKCHVQYYKYKRKHKVSYVCTVTCNVWFD